MAEDELSPGRDSSPLQRPSTAQRVSDHDNKVHDVDRDDTGGINRAGDVVLHVPKSHVASVINRERAGWLRCRVLEPEDDVLLISKKGQAIRFRADDAQLRPMGRATSGVTGMKFRDTDALLSMSVIRAAQVAAEEAAGLSEHDEDAARVDTEDPAVAELVENVKAQYVFTMTDGGYAKRTRISDYRLQGRGGLGIKAMALVNEAKGSLVGGFIVEDGDEVLSITQSGQVVRSPIDDNFPAKGRSTQGVKFVTPKKGDSVALVARSVESTIEEDEANGEATSGDEGAAESEVSVPDATIGATEADAPAESD
jgi:DNA gyrase subunit A